jgi:YebC/PmpR family DNA-binding regulatory protein
MSGHSKWAKIKRQKTASDIKKGEAFTKLARAITIAVREGGGDKLDSNFMLRMAVEKAKEANVPKDNIERAIKKGMGESEEGRLENMSYDIVGKEGIAFIVDVITDNKRRTVSDLRTIVTRVGFNLGNGSSLWQFEQRGLIILEPVEKIPADRFKDGVEFILKKLNIDELVLNIMEIDGVEDVSPKEVIGEEGEKVETIEILTAKEKLAPIYKQLAAKNYKITKVTVAKVPKTFITVSEQAQSSLKRLIGEIEELDETESVWPNVKL